MSTLTGGLIFRSCQGTPDCSFRTVFEHAVPLSWSRRFHVLRLVVSPYTSRLVVVGVDFATVQDLRGYKDISMILCYTHLSSCHKRRTGHAMAQFGEKSHSNVHNRGQGRGLMHLISF